MRLLVDRSKLGLAQFLKNMVPDSPWGFKLRIAQDDGPGGKSVDLPPGTSVPSLIRRVYGPVRLFAFSGRFGFLKRDQNFDKKSTSSTSFDNGVKDNPFFSSAFSTSPLNPNHPFRMFASESNVLAEKAGFSLVEDKDRGFPFPEVPFTSKTPDAPFVIANSEIVKKLCLIRSTPSGWWTAGYNGKDSQDLKYFLPAIDLVVEVIHELLNSPAGKSKREELMKKQGDPLDTNVGFPTFSNEYSSEGVPVAKIDIVTRLAGMGSHIGSFKAFKQFINSKIQWADTDQDDIVIAAAIRRSQPGWKWTKIFSPGSAGLQVEGEVRGLSTTRVAFMPPYYVNLALSPIQTDLKTARSLIPGLMMSTDERERITRYFKNHPSTVQAESDYSNYDRYIPHDVAIAFFSQLSAKLYPKQRQFCSDLLAATNSRVGLIYPDATSSPDVAKGHGWLFYPEKVGLLSGLKITSELGTFINLIINMAGWLNTKLMTKQEAKSYLTQSSRINRDDPKTTWSDLRLLIQSDDLLVVAQSEDQLRKMIHAFEQSATKAGLKHEVSRGDRFLMRHTTKACDLPVVARVLQNTLSSEKPTIDPLICFLGYMVRSDGLGGVRIADPFKLGAYTAISRFYLGTSLSCVRILLAAHKNSTSVIPSLVEYMEMQISLFEGLERNFEGGLSAGQIQIISKMKRIQRSTAQAIAKKAGDLGSTTGLFSSSKGLMNYLYQLQKDSFSPSSELILSQISSLSPELEEAVLKVTARDHAFYSWAMTKLKLPLFYE